MEEKQWGLTTEQKQVSGVFYNNSPNGIIIYTEDTDNEHEFYVRFYERLLENTGVIIDKLLQLGNCDKVQQACQEDNDTSFPKLYVIDGDIYLQYDPKQSQGRLCVLDRYCIENYLIDENTICSAIQRFKPIDINKIKQTLNYTSILQEFAVHFVPIYHYYSLLSEENKKLKSSKTACFEHKKYNCFYEISSNSYMQNRISQFISEMESELLQIPNITRSYINKNLDKRRTKFPCNIEILIKIVSAKDDIFPFLISVITKSFERMPSLPLAVWKFNCVDFYDTTPLDFLKEKIVTIYNEWKELQKTKQPE